MQNFRVPLENPPKKPFLAKKLRFVAFSMGSPG
jgi:hypothetical protein